MRDASTGNRQRGTTDTPNPSRITHRASRPTTDPQHELFDLLDEHGRPTGERKPRWQVHRDGDWHAALHIWVGGNRADGTPFVLFQRRSPTKDTWPGYLDIVVGGHLRAGETLIETAREAEEEIGLTVTLDDLTPIGRRFIAGGSDGVIDRELQHVYAVRRDDPLSSYLLHPEEVSAIVAITISDALALFSDEVMSIPAIERRRGEADESIELRRDDFAGSDDAYLLRATGALEQILRGEHPEAFEIRTDDRSS